MDFTTLAEIVLISWIPILFFFTQRIYNSKKTIFFIFWAALVVFFILGVWYHFLIQIWMVLLYAIYAIWLFLIRLAYKKLNRLFVGKKWIDKEYGEKDFTFVVISKTGRDIWNAKAALRPTWLDRAASISIVIVPLIILLLVMNTMPPGR
ncbi:MAG: hypothetical protein K0S33_1219 [Bacteroidetes bacterium]|jgi:hypothetical protein|nr:hypothetical protein [Bacteroidota bacterium]